MVSNFLRILLIAMLLSSPHGRAADAPPLVRQGFAFDRPAILIQQHLFGLAHGVSLLADACAQDARYRESSADAYRTWHERQAPAVAAAERALAHYYFGARAAEATRDDIAHALKLKDRLAQAPGSQELQEACATFPQALRNPRYDLVVQGRLQLMAAHLETGSMIEATAEACRASLARPDAATLEAAYTQWHAEHAAQIAEAHAALAAEWPLLQWQGTLDEFVNAARQRGKISATRTRCQAMARQIRIEDDQIDDALPRP